MDDPSQDNLTPAPPEEPFVEKEDEERLGKLGFGLAFVPWAVMLLLFVLKPG